MSAFSLPVLSYHALISGSDMASTSSWPSTDSIASTPGDPLGDVSDCAAHDDRHRLALPTHAYLMDICDDPNGLK
jgi:hypothetical protein